MVSRLEWYDDEHYFSFLSNLIFALTVENQVHKDDNRCREVITDECENDDWQKDEKKEEKFEDSARRFFPPFQVIRTIEDSPHVVATITAVGEDETPASDSRSSSLSHDRSLYDDPSIYDGPYSNASRSGTADRRGTCSLGRSRTATLEMTATLDRMATLEQRTNMQEYNRLVWALLG